MKIEIWPVFKLIISTGLHHYLDTIPRTDKRMIAINIGFKDRMILHLFLEEYQSNVYYVIYIM